MKKIKVLHYLSNLGLGGTEKTCQLFIDYASADIEPYLVYKSSGDHPRLKEFELALKLTGGKCIPIDYPEELQAIINNLDIDIVHVYRSGYPEFPEPGIDIKCKAFVETNVFGFFDANQKVDKSLYMSKWLMKHSLNRLGANVLNVYKNRFDFVNNPVEDPWTNKKLDIEIPEGSIVLGRCGRPDNGIYNSINTQAAKLLQMQGYKVFFIVVAPPSNMIDDLIDWQIPFHAIDPTVDPDVLSRFYNTVDIYCHARADGETFGVNIAEAMMHGKPIITHIAVPSVPGMGVFQSQTELVDNGINGYVVENHPLLYAEKIKELIDNKDLRIKMGNSAKEKAQLEYSATVCTKKLESIYRDIIS
jgi:glycosyltransferase involved in cell wall biosynthesis